MKKNDTAIALALRLVETAQDKEIQSLPNAMEPCDIALWRRLREGPVDLRELEKEHSDSLPRLHFLLQRFWESRALVLSCPIREPEVEITAAVNGELFNFAVNSPDGPWKLSRFAFIHVDNGSLLVETPRVPVLTKILKPRLGALLSVLTEPKTTRQIADETDWTGDLDEVSDLLFLLSRAGVITACDTDGNAEEDLNPSLVQWEFHDLLFHSRSRQGRHCRAMGASFRFKGKLAPQPTVKSNPWASVAFPLPRPDPTAIAATDPPFTMVLETRRSIRKQNFLLPISMPQLAEFLFRTSRIRYRYPTSLGEFTSRPYPSGGASYELELYITVNLCAGLERGFYYYDAEAHTLGLIQKPDAEMEALLDEAWVSAAFLCRPQVLITIASRFHRVSWKYSGMAYAAQLKNVGVLYQTFYLVATAMNLAACGLGLGNSARFCRMAGTNYFDEGSIGEFMIGSSAES